MMFRCLACLFVAGLTVCSTAADRVDAISRLLKVDHFGAGSTDAAKAYEELIQFDRSVLPEILQAFDKANPLAENYLRSAFEVIADTDRGDLPLDDLLKFVGEKSHNPRARAMVFEWYATIEPDKADAMLDQFLLDPSGELRRKAVQKKIDAAVKLNDESKSAESIAEYKTALKGAVDEDQVKTIAEALKKSGEEVDLVAHFGLLSQWRIIGPFDNKDQKGFDVAYPPEKELNFDATYEGMTGEVKWQPIVAAEEMGKVDIAKQVAPHKGAVMYMYTEFEAEKAGEVWFRMSTPNAWKLWVDGELVFAREEYHRGMRWDQYRVKADVKAGKNKLLLKILQNEQTQDWAQTYAIQFRVCDKEGVAIAPAEPFRVSSR